MSEIIDISVPLVQPMPVWPGSVGIDISQTMCLASGDPANVSHLNCDVHVGTHLEAPRHVLASGPTLDQFPLELLIGPVVVSDLTEAEAVTGMRATANGTPASPGVQPLSELPMAGRPMDTTQIAAIMATLLRTALLRIISSPIPRCSASKREDQIHPGQRISGQATRGTPGHLFLYP